VSGERATGAGTVAPMAPDRTDWFCCNPECVLHVAMHDESVEGIGDWATRPDGIVTGRGLYFGEILCDLCGRARIRRRDGPPTE
jgi:hypothetical protein